jgi:hypothetical protein
MQEKHFHPQKNTNISTLMPRQDQTFSADKVRPEIQKLKIVLFLLTSLKTLTKRLNKQESLSTLQAGLKHSRNTME